ncbi:MAG: oligosaccharide repeat unit polymerase [Opitutales bacterium]
MEFRIARCVFYSVFFVILFLPLRGDLLFSIVGCVFLLDIAIIYLGKRSQLNPISFFQLGFIFILCMEGIFSYKIISGIVGEDNVDFAVQLLSQGGALLILGYLVCEKEVGRHGMLFLKNPAHGKNLVILFYIICIYQFLPMAYFTIRFGRHYGYGNEFAAINILPSFLVFPLFIISILAPSLICIYFKAIGCRNWTRKSLIYAAPLLLLIILGGRRYMILYAFLPVIFICFGGQDLQLKKIIRLSVVGLLILASAVSTYYLRWGIDNLSVDLLQERVFDVSTTFNENAVRRMALATDYYRFESHEPFHNTAYIFTFFIPRVFWQDKPIKMEIWFPQVYERERRRSSYSASMSFMAPFYGDFGYGLSLVFACLLGVFISFIRNLLTSRLLQMGQFTDAINGVLAAGLFFLPRQLGTAWAQTIGFLIIIIAIRFFFFSRYEKV